MYAGEWQLAIDEKDMSLRGERRPPDLGLWTSDFDRSAGVPRLSGRRLAARFLRNPFHARPAGFGLRSVSMRRAGTPAGQPAGRRRYGRGPRSD